MMLRLRPTLSRPLQSSVRLAQQYKRNCYIMLSLSSPMQLQNRCFSTGSIIFVQKAIDMF